MTSVIYLGFAGKAYKLNKNRSIKQKRISTYMISRSRFFVISSDLHWLTQTQSWVRPSSSSSHAKKRSIREKSSKAKSPSLVELMQVYVAWRDWNTPRKWDILVYLTTPPPRHLMLSATVWKNSLGIHWYTSGVDPVFFSGGDAPLRNGVTDW